MALSLSSLEFGAGPPVVVVHGLFGSARNWAGIGKALGETHKVYALDLRNHGASPWDDDTSFAAMAEDVRGFITERALERPILIGHSLGGKVAMTLALAGGVEIAALVVVDIAPTDYRGDALLGFAEAMRAMDLTGLTRRAEADARLAAAIADPGIRAFLLQNLELDGEARWRINLDAIIAGLETMGGFPAASSGKSYPGPTLFLGGGKSDYIRAEHHATIRQLFPAAEIDTIEGAGHWVHAERPQEFLARLGAFLGGVDD